jgi:uncharacterized protein
MMDRVVSRLAIALMMALAVTACAGAASSSSSKATPNGCDAGKSMATSEAGLDQILLCIRSGQKSRSFTVEMARTGQQQSQGLMFRTALADDRGMLFPFPDERMASFWMRNTLIPLDIVFIAGDGRIVNIVANATPYSLDHRESLAPVGAVLELRGGLTAQLGIKAGDKVTWAAPLAK